MSTSSGPSPKILLLDSASLYFRAFYGVPETGQAPVPTNAMRGFLDMVATLVTTHRPTHLVACWDDDWRPQFRVDAIPTYKTHRLDDGSTTEEAVPDDLAPQVPVIADALAALGIVRVGVPGCEADDVIGSYVERFRGTHPVDVVTGDRDLFQLVDDANHVRVLYTARGGVRDPDVVTESFLAEKYGVTSGDQYADMSILRGDSSDGLPGVPGIGEKTAAALMAQYGDLAGLRAAVDGGDPAIKGVRRARLEEAAGYLDVAPSVVRVVRDADLPDADPVLPTEVADPAELSRLATGYGLTGPLGRVVTAMEAG
jgi:5'-3' exonuclease